MAKQPKQKGRSEAPASSKAREGTSPESAGYDKKLDGPNRPSV
ncbi:hypothetical protein [Cohnella sp. JJ-181]|nr:hypothetical protein [Cohnella sp. JJ-181]CAI6065383.1 hypothetical protein COHCIP112018_02059 [Cohnella sp. JJ-181]